jgi:hypothetical protein
MLPCPRTSFPSIDAGYLVSELWTAVLGHLGIPIPGGIVELGDIKD